MENSLKLKLVVYSVISAAGFSYLVLPEKSGIGVFIFTVMQALCLWFLAPDRKKIWLFLPVILFGANAFISGNNMWRMPNLFISVFIYALMFIDFNPADTALKYFNDIIVRILEPVTTFRLPFIWAAEINREKAPVIKRIFKAFIITVPCIILLIYLLSNADMIFSKGVSQCFDYILEFIRPSAIFKIILGIFAGLYLFGILYAAYTKPKSGFTIQKNIRGDVLISNIFLISALAVYTIFVIIQFKYLFAGGQLPYGLTYTEYARKGFFELLALSFVNILIILIIVNITKGQTGQGLILSKILCCYLCAVTLILLASSFYRMWLYNIDDGLTRLRFMVFGFLIFEAAGLIVTFIYIIKPKSHISSIYLAIALCYYSLLNIVPMDFFIAQNQINKYLNGEREDLAYIFTLSSDAAVPISRLSDDITNRHKFNYSTYFNSLNDKNSKLPKRWQRYNLSLSHAEKICESLDLKNDTFFTQS